MKVGGNAEVWGINIREKEGQRKRKMCGSVTLTFICFMWESSNVLMWLGHDHIEVMIRRYWRWRIFGLYNEKGCLVWEIVIDPVIDLYPNLLQTFLECKKKMNSLWTFFQFYDYILFQKKLAVFSSLPTAKQRKRNTEVRRANQIHDAEPCSQKSLQKISVFCRICSPSVELNLILANVTHPLHVHCVVWDTSTVN